MPKKGSTLNFKHFFKSMRVPFIVHSDFESFTQKLDTAQPNPDDSYTKPYQKHTPSGFCNYIKCFDDEVYKRIKLKQNLVIYTKQTEDEDVSQIFVDRLEQNIKDIYTKCGRTKMIMSKNSKEISRRKQYAGYVNEFLIKISGNDRGAAHNDCNLKYRNPKFIPVVFHNLSGYDSHLFIKNLGKSEGNINCIPNNEEKYISFTKKYPEDLHSLHYNYPLAPERVTVNKPNYKHCTIFDENLVAVHMKKTKIRFDKPVYFGMCILDLSKTLMYDFHFNYIKPNYILDAYGSSGAKLLFTDTDSLAYNIKTEDFTQI
ncbi:hypothetical protein MAR_021023 [Mya arenaria]|uniref:DNA-directed DNA polymerase n=1 Tax=Mya arenaria TaxID=6604 RepID=A0ABY7E8Z9_MYAAR|nr:hypothetical protein MAR_021023 [Mya arenaria]